RGAYGITWEPAIQYGSGYEALLGYNGSVSLPRSVVPGPFPSFDPVTYWTGLASASIPSFSTVGFPAFTGTLPNTSPSIGEGNGVQYIPASSLRSPQVQNWNFG